METTLLSATDPATAMSGIAQAAMLLACGEVVAFPTETVYGLGADAFNVEAVRKVFAAKGRPADNPLIVHVATPDEVFEIARIDKRAVHLAQSCMPGPLTIVLPALPNIPSIVRAGLSTVAVRVPSHPVAAALLSLSGPLVAPSANRSGRPSPTAARHVLDDLDGRIAAILDGGPCEVGIESTVVDLSGAQAIILRPGTITQEQIQSVIGEYALRADQMPDQSSVPKSPGMKYRHYAPSVPVRLIIGREPPVLPEATHRIVLTTPQHLAGFPNDDARELNERTLYAHLRQADDLNVTEVVIYAQPEEVPAGLMDRIRRAAGT